jgi:hypothetical protein
VGPGKYHVRLKFAATRGLDTRTNCFDVLLNGNPVAEKLDVSATAAGPNKAADLVFNDVTPRNGIIEIRLKAPAGSNTNSQNQAQAFLQALEVGPGVGGKGAHPIMASVAK